MLLFAFPLASRRRAAIPRVFLILRLPIFFTLCCAAAAASALRH